MAHYLIANYRVSNAGADQRYLELVSATTAAHDAEVLFAEFDSTIVEGSATQSASWYALPNGMRPKAGITYPNIEPSCSTGKTTPKALCCSPTTPNRPNLVTTTRTSRGYP